MVEQSTSKTIVSCVAALMLIVSFSAAPVAAATTQDSVVDDDTIEISGIDLDTSDSDGTNTDGVDVRIVRTNSPVQTGETLKVRVDLESENGGQVDLLIDGERVDGGSYPQGFDGKDTYTWDTSFTDAGEHNATVRSGSDSDSTTVEVEPGADAPQELCTNVPKRANENVPYEELPSSDQLPEQVPNPIPPFVGPRAIANLVVGAAPNQCEIQDPNDPSVDPNDPPTEPSVSIHVFRLGQYKDGGAMWMTYEVTLDESSGGPGVSGTLGGVVYSGGVDANPDATVTDGKQEYSVDPYFNGDDSTSESSLEASAPFGGGGGSLKCSGGECQPGTTGIPTFTEYPAIPAPIWDG